jgi:hypothetical protein
MSGPKLLGNVDLLGLNSFGENPGMNPLWGVLIGGSVSGLTSAGLARGTGRASQHSDLIGLLAGIATGGVMWSMKSTRHAAFGAFAGAFFASGLRWLENTLFGPSPAAVAPVAVAPGTKGVGLPMMQPLNGLGLPMMQPLNGLGLPSIGPSIPPQGAIPGVAGPQINGMGGGPPVSLLGQSMGHGGPSISGLSARYGATLLGGR